MNKFRIQQTFNYDYVIKNKLVKIKYKLDRINDHLFSNNLESLSNEIKEVINFYDKLKQDLKESEIE